MNSLELSLLDLLDYLDEFNIKRIKLRMQRGKYGKDGVIYRLNKLDNELVAWFKERGISLLVDRDTNTYERIIP